MAMDRNKLIGSQGGMPWHLPSEMQYFKKITMGKPLVMGRKTFESIGRPLPGRTSIVVTRNSSWPDDVDMRAKLEEFLENGQLKVAETLEQAIDIAKSLPAAEPSAKAEEPEIAIIGGAAICELAMPIVERLYLTVIDAEFEGDTWLSSFSRDDWELVSETQQSVDGFSLSYQVLEKTA